MSRDWTPRESYVMNKEYHRKNGQYLYEVPMFMKVGDDIVREYPTKEELNLARKYPHIAITGIDLLFQLWDSVSEETLQSLDGYLKELCEEDTFASKSYYPGYKSELNNEPINKWYNGELDSHFYYRERNDEYLMDYISKVKDPSEIRESNRREEFDKEEIIHGAEAPWDVEM